MTTYTILAAFTGTLSGLATFGPDFLIGLALVDSEVDTRTRMHACTRTHTQTHTQTQTYASALFGGAIAIAGVVSTPLGGFLVDKFAGTSDDLTRRLVALGQMFLYIVVACAFTMLCSFQTDIVLFMGALGLGVFFALATTAGVTVHTHTHMHMHMRTHARTRTHAHTCAQTRTGGHPGLGAA